MLPLVAEQWRPPEVRLLLLARIRELATVLLGPLVRQRDLPGGCVLAVRLLAFPLKDVYRYQDRARSNLRRPEVQESFVTEGELAELY